MYNISIKEAHKHEHSKKDDPMALPDPHGPFSGLARMAQSNFSVHFIDVGQADAAVVLCDGQAMLIDGGNTEDSSLVYSYLSNTLGLEELDYVVATHPHEDHVGGAGRALNACPVQKIYSPVRDYDSEAFRDFQKYAGSRA